MPEKPPGDPTREQQTPLFALDFKQRVLAKAILNENLNATANYGRSKTGGVATESSFSETEYRQLLERFKKDPKDCLAIGRQNIYAIAGDEAMPKAERERRLNLYLDAFLDLQIQLDHQVYLPNEAVVHSGVPDYVPDGLTDMGSNPELNPLKRSREKIRVNKKEMFLRARELLHELFSSDFGNMNSTQRKIFLTDRVAQYVYAQLPYNYDEERGEKLDHMDRTINLHEIEDERLAVCRHHALYAQVLLQTLGISSRILKCRLDSNDGSPEGAHAANLVRINTKWYLLDPTNPDIENHSNKTFLAPLPEQDIDTNKKNYTWDTPRKHKNQTWTYSSRNNMFYRIMDNSKNLGL